MIDRTAPAKEASAEELLPCPFCGGPSKLREVGDRHNGHEVECVSCGASVYGFGTTSPRLAWNRRSSPVREQEKNQERILPAESDVVQNKEEKK